MTERESIIYLVAFALPDKSVSKVLEFVQGEVAAAKRRDKITETPLSQAIEQLCELRKDGRSTVYDMIRLLKLREDDLSKAVRHIMDKEQDEYLLQPWKAWNSFYHPFTPSDRETEDE